MIWMMWNRGPLMNSQPSETSPLGGLDPSAGPTSPAPPEVPPAPPAAPPEGEIRMSSQALNERLKRERAAFLRQQGFESEEQLQAFKREHEERRKAEEEARRAQQSREEQLQEDLRAAQQAREEAEAEAEALRFQNHVSGICARVGVRNLGYAMHIVTEEASRIPDDQELDVEEFLRQRLDAANAEHAMTRAALGIESSPTPAARPATTTAVPGQEPPEPPPAGGGNPTEQSAFDMDPGAWAAKKAELGIG